MEAGISMESIYKMLSSLTDNNKRWLADHLYQDLGEKSRYGCRGTAISDEELSMRLSMFPDWEDNPHPDLSAVDYSKYKPYKSRKTINTISKWL